MCAPDSLLMAKKAQGKIIADARLAPCEETSQFVRVITTWVDSKGITLLVIRASVILPRLWSTILESVDTQGALWTSVKDRTCSSLALTTRILLSFTITCYLACSHEEQYVCVCVFAYIRYRCIYIYIYIYFIRMSAYLPAGLAGCLSACLSVHT